MTDAMIEEASDEAFEWLERGGWRRIWKVIKVIIVVIVLAIIASVIFLFETIN